MGLEKRNLMHKGTAAQHPLNKTELSTAGKVEESSVLLWNQSEIKIPQRESYSMQFGQFRFYGIFGFIVYAINHARMGSIRICR